MKSQELIGMLKYRKGYRNDDISTGHYTIQDVLEHEIEELGNTDIYITCKRMYGTQDVRNLIDKKFGDVDLYGLWLTSKEGVKVNYMGEGETRVTEYNITQDALPISDLTDEGSLFVVTVHPDNLWEKITRIK